MPNIVKLHFTTLTYISINKFYYYGKIYWKKDSLNQKLYFILSKSVLIKLFYSNVVISFAKQECLKKTIITAIIAVKKTLCKLINLYYLCTTAINTAIKLIFKLWL